MFGLGNENKKKTSHKRHKKVEDKITIDDIRTRLHLTANAPDEKIKFELNKIKNRRFWKERNVTEDGIRFIPFIRPRHLV